MSEHTQVQEHTRETRSSDSKTPTSPSRKQNDFATNSDSKEHHHNHSKHQEATKHSENFDEHVSLTSKQFDQEQTIVDKDKKDEKNVSKPTDESKEPAQSSQDKEDRRFKPYNKSDDGTESSWRQDRNRRPGEGYPAYKRYDAGRDYNRAGYNREGYNTRREYNSTEYRDYRSSSGTAGNYSTVDRRTDSRYADRKREREYPSRTDEDASKRQRISPTRYARNSRERSADRYPTATAAHTPSSSSSASSSSYRPRSPRTSNGTGGRYTEEERRYNDNYHGRGYDNRYDSHSNRSTDYDNRRPGYDSKRPSSPYRSQQYSSGYGRGGGQDYRNRSASGGGRYDDSYNRPGSAGRYDNYGRGYSSGGSSRPWGPQQGLDAPGTERTYNRRPYDSNRTWQPRPNSQDFRSNRPYDDRKGYGRDSGSWQQPAVSATTTASASTPAATTTNPIYEQDTRTDTYRGEYGYDQRYPQPAVEQRQYPAYTAPTQTIPATTSTTAAAAANVAPAAATTVPAAAQPPLHEGPPPKLPPNWAEYTTKEGRTYYHNSQTKVSQWEFPKE